MERYTGIRYAFGKFDFVMIPAFQFGGMEHAGATFLREDRVIFPQEPTKNDHISRATLIFHDAQKTFPSGGWGYTWAPHPDRGYGIEQPGSWIYSILPQLEQENLAKLGSGAGFRPRCPRFAHPRRA